tara:strand:+ start:90783 stop:91382 length:600 start_codon:yes stop_codon:yes gene_type:complete
MQPERRMMRRADLAASDDGQTVKGYAAVFNSDADIGGYWIERIAPGAFSASLDGDVRALVDHDSGRVVGRTDAGTLRLNEDERGLACEIDLPDTNDGRDMAVLIKRGDITGMSFGFIVTKQEWDETVDPPVRTIQAVDLHEVSIVAFPAYQDTEIALRSSQAVVELRKRTDIARTAAAAQARDAYSRRKAEAEHKFRRI